MSAIDSHAIPSVGMALAKVTFGPLPVANGKEEKSASSTELVYQPQDDWRDPNVECFEMNDAISWRYWKNLDPPEQYLDVKKTTKTYEGKVMTFYNIFHKKHPGIKLSVITPFAKARRVRLGLGNWAYNPANKHLTGKARDCLAYSLKKISVTCELTRGAWDPHLADDHERNKVFMEYLAWREKVQLWAAKWICEKNEAPNFVADVKNAVKASERDRIEGDARAVIGSATKRFKAGKITAQELDAEKADALKEQEEQLKALKEKPVDLDLMAKKYMETKMHQTYAFHLDKVLPDDGKQGENGEPPAKARRMDDKGEEVKKVTKPGTEHAPFKKAAFRNPWKKEFDEKNPYIPPSPECAEVYADPKCGMVYDAPTFFEVAKLGQQVTLGGEDTKEQKQDQPTQMMGEDPATLFKRPIPDSSVMAIEYEMSIYTEAQGKSGVKDEWMATWFLQPPSDEELARQQEWRVNGKGSKYAGRNLQAMPKVSCAKPYKPTAAYGQVEEDEQTRLETLKAMQAQIAADIAAAEAKKQLEASKNGDKKEPVPAAAASSSNGSSSAPAKPEPPMPATEPLPLPPSFAEASKEDADGDSEMQSAGSSSRFSIKGGKGKRKNR